MTVIVAIPFATPVTRPFPSTVAILLLSLFQVKFKSVFALLGCIVAFNLTVLLFVLKSIIALLLSSAAPDGYTKINFHFAYKLISVPLIVDKLLISC